MDVQGELPHNEELCYLSAVHMVFARTDFSPSSPSITWLRFTASKNLDLFICSHVLADAKLQARYHTVTSGKLRARAFKCAFGLPFRYTSKKVLT